MYICCKRILCQIGRVMNSSHRMLRCVTSQFRLVLIYIYFILDTNFMYIIRYFRLPFLIKQPLCLLSCLLAIQWIFCCLFRFELRNVHIISLTASFFSLFLLVCLLFVTFDWIWLIVISLEEHHIKRQNRHLFFILFAQWAE